MADQTAIAWTDHTFNPWIGCVKVSQGCKHCYAETLVRDRLRRPGLWGPASTHSRAQTTPSLWRKPLAWNAAARKEGRRHRVFAGSLCDVFEAHPDLEGPRRDLWALIRRTPFLDWQLLTKRPEHIRACLPSDWSNGWRNVWLGTSIEDDRVAVRANLLRDVPAVVHFISYEPALGPLERTSLEHIEWVIYGGESGPNYRDHDVQWARDIRSRCARSGAAFFFKQSAAPRTEMGIHLDGELVRNYPAPTLPAHPWPSHEYVEGRTRAPATLELGV